MADATFILGKKAELTIQESTNLRHLAEEMHRSCISQQQGWFLRYLTAHREAHAIISSVMKRAHAS